MGRQKKENELKKKFQVTSVRKMSHLIEQEYSLLFVSSVVQTLEPLVG